MAGSVEAHNPLRKGCAPQLPMYVVYVFLKHSARAHPVYRGVFCIPKSTIVWYSMGGIWEAVQMKKTMLAAFVLGLAIGIIGALEYKTFSTDNTSKEKSRE